MRTFIAIALLVLLVGVVPVISLWAWAISSFYDFSPTAMAHPLRPFWRLAFTAVISVLVFGLFGYVAKRSTD
jgi:hypothetical protein